MERVSVIEGKSPVILVCPHGFDKDDEQTSVIAESVAHAIRGYAVINRGWERAAAVDHLKDKADCNNVEHCHQDVVREEFLDPILRFRNRLRRTHELIYVYIIHGMANKHRLVAGDPSMDAVIGYGAGSPASHTCDPWRKDAFIHLLGMNGINAYEGKLGGGMSGWTRRNMNQLFRKWYYDETVQSMQVELVHELRQDKETAEMTAEYLACAMSDMLAKTRYTGPKNSKKY